MPRSNARTIPTVAVLIIKDRKVLLVRHREAAGHETGTYGLPSGRIGSGKSEKGAAIRELEEESGLKATEADLVEFPRNFYVADLLRKGGTTMRFAWRVFLCKNYSGKLSSSEESVPEWIEIEKMSQYNLLPNIKSATLAGLKYLGNENEN